MSVRSEATPTNKPPLINTSPAMGTISQRRGKSSAPPSTAGDAPSPTDSTLSAASAPTMGRIASALPPNTVNNILKGGRDRAYSQPGRRPSIVTVNSYPSLQGGSPAPRKVSIPSRLNPSSPPQITLNMALLRGALIEYGAGLIGPIPNVVIFQFNPESLSRSLQIPQRPTGATQRETTQAGEKTFVTMGTHADVLWVVLAGGLLGLAWTLLLTHA